MYDAKKVEDKDKEKSKCENCTTISDRFYFGAHISQQISHTKLAYIPKETMFF